MTEKILIGKFLKPYGLKGFIKADFFIDSIEDLSNFSVYSIKDPKIAGKYIDLPQFDVEYQAGHLCVKFKDKNDRTSIELYKGLEIFVNSDEMPKLEGNEFYIKDLLDMAVYYKGGLYGSVNLVDDIAQETVLYIKREGMSDLVVPFKSPFVGDVDVENKKLELLEIEELI